MRKWQASSVLKVLQNDLVTLQRGSAASSRQDFSSGRKLRQDEGRSPDPSSFLTYTPLINLVAKQTHSLHHPGGPSLLNRDPMPQWALELAKP